MKKFTCGNMTSCRETVATSDCLKTSGFCRKPGAWQNGNVLNSFAKKKLFGQALTAKISTPWPFIGIGKFGFQSINLKFWRSKTMGSLEATRFSPPPLPYWNVVAVAVAAAAVESISCAGRWKIMGTPGITQTHTSTLYLRLGNFFFKISLPPRQVAPRTCKHGEQVLF